jgi:hypothetical protein
VNRRLVRGSIWDQRILEAQNLLQYPYNKATLSTLLAATRLTVNPFQEWGQVSYLADTSESWTKGGATVGLLIHLGLGHLDQIGERDGPSPHKHRAGNQIALALWENPNRLGRNSPSYYFVPTPISTSPGTSRPLGPSKRLSCS